MMNDKESDLGNWAAEKEGAGDAFCTILTHRCDCNKLKRPCHGCG